MASDLLGAYAGATPASLWIGLERRVVDDWDFAWASGEAVAYTKRNSGEPNNASGEPYDYIYFWGKWNDLADVIG